MSEIPPEIFREILLRLPAESLFRFRTVCKAWRRLIDNPSFVKAHAHKYNQLSSNTLVIRDSTGELFYSLSLDDRHTIDAIPVKQLIRRRGSPWLPRLPMASCNGLILIWDSYVWEIWNPLTSDCLKLPQPDIGDIIYLMAIGIGYDYAADDYEVVRIDDFSRDGVIVYRTLVYSMKLGSWRMIKDCPYDIRWGCEGVFLNGALHWTSRDMIVAFNLETEDYGQLKLPPVQSRPEPARSVHLDVLGGCLVLTYYHRTMDHFDGWVMNDYGVEKSWAKLFSLRKLDIVGAWSRLRPVAYLKGKRQILLQHDGGFFWLDVEDNSIKKVTVHGASGISSAQICPGSLFRLDVGGSVAGNRKGVKRKRKPSRNTVDTM